MDEDMPMIPNAAAPLSRPSDGIVGLFHTGIIWDGREHRPYQTVPMKFEQISGSQGNLTVMTDVDVRASDVGYWSVVDNLAKDFQNLCELFERKLDTLNLPDTGGRSDFRKFWRLGKLHRLDSLRLLAEKKMMGYFNSRFPGDRRINHKVLGFGPVTLPATLVYQEDDRPSELLIRQVNNLSTVEQAQSRIFYSKAVWNALCRLFKINSWAPLVWLYMNTVSLGLQKEGGQSIQGTQLLIARLLDRINMSPFDFANLDIAGYLASIMMLFSGYSLSANNITPENWLYNFPIQVLHDFTPANATEHYNGQVDLLSRSGWKREGGSLPVSSCPFYTVGGPGAPGIYPISISSEPDRKNQVQIPLDFGGYNFKQDGTEIPSIPADFDRMFGWMHDPQAEGVVLNVRSIMPWMLLAAPPIDRLYSPMDFWDLYFYTVHSTGFKIIDTPNFHPMHWFVGFESILPGNGFPVVVDGDVEVSTQAGRGKRKGQILEWISERPFKLERKGVAE